MPPLMSPDLRLAAPGLLLYFALACTPTLLLRMGLLRSPDTDKQTRHFGYGE